MNRVVRGQKIMQPNYMDMLHILKISNAILYYLSLLYTYLLLTTCGFASLQFFTQNYNSIRLVVGEK